MLKYEEGNILDEKYTVFCHQVNCQHKMGSGLAKQIREKYPEVYEEYMKVTNQELGKTQFVETHDGRICINMFAQDKYGTDKRYTNYLAFEKCLTFIKHCLDVVPETESIAFPYLIGCGLAGGDWKIILGMLTRFSEEVKQDVIIVKLK